MIHLRLFGAVDLRHDDGAEARSVLAQPRRVALLAYLALRSPEGGTRRDTLLGLFWPESDAARARGALRNALHFLRRSLGPDAIPSEGDEEVRLSPERVWCDAVAYERLLADGRSAEALELYRGDLLEGFFISDAPEFERWLEVERRRLRRKAVAVSAELARVAESEGRLELAVHHARRAHTLSEDDEAAAGRLVTLLWRSGDRTGALRAHEAHVRRLRDVYDLEPSPEMAALPGRLAGESPPAAPTAIPADERAGTRADAPAEARVELGGGTRAPAGARAGTAEAPAATRSATDPGRPDELAPTRRFPRVGRARAILLASVVLAVVAAGLLWSARGPASEPSPDAVAVFPFSYRGSAEHSFLGEGLVSLLSAGLDGAGALRSVEPRTLLSGLDRQDSRLDDPRRAGRAGRQLGAGLFVLGQVVETGGRVRVRAALYRASDEGPPSRLREASVEGRIEELFDLVDALAAQLLEGRGGPGARSFAGATRSLAALKAYQTGETEYRSGRYEAALTAFQRAVEADSAFALAHFRLSNAAVWLGRGELGRREAAHALRLADRVPLADSLLFAAWHEARFGDFDQAESLYRRAVALRPEDAEAWLELGELLFHWGPAVGRPIAESGPAFERVLALDPRHGSAHLHLARLAAADGRAVELAALVDRAIEEDPQATWALELSTLRELLSGDPVRRERSIQAAGRADERTAGEVLRSVSAFSGDLDAAERLARELGQPFRSEALRAHLEVLLLDLDLAHGRWREAVRRLEAEGTLLPPARQLEYRAAIATLPFLPVSDAELVALRTALRDSLTAHPPLPPPWDARWRGSAEFPPLLWEGLHAPRRLYLEGSLSARLGDVAAARRAAETLERMGRDGERLGEGLARLLRARLARVAGEPRRALASLGPPRIPPERTYERLLDYPRGYERFLRAELSEAVGRPEEALRWYATFPSATAANLAYLGPAHLRRARLHDAAGDRAAAIHHYERFLRLWEGADPELRPAVERVRERLAELR